MGWTWDVAESQLDLHRLRAFNRHWQAQPPVHALVAAYLRYKPPEHREADQTEMLATLVSGMAVNRNAPQLDTSAWDAAIQPVATPPVAPVGAALHGDQASG